MINHVKENLFYLRKSKSLNQEKFSNELNIKRSTYANWESGHTEPPIAALLHICRYFGITMTDLVTTDISKGKVLSDFKEIISDKVSDKVSGKVSGKFSENLLFDENSLREYDEDLTRVGRQINSKYIPNVFIVSSSEQQILKETIANNNLSKLPMIYVPDVGRGLHFQFTYYSEDMEPTIKDGDKLIASLVKRPSQSIDYGNLFILLKDGEIDCKRIAKVELLNAMRDDKDKIITDFKYILECDNHYDSKNFEIKSVEIFSNLTEFDALFKVIEIQSRDLSIITASRQFLYYKLKEKWEKFEKKDVKPTLD